MKNVYKISGMTCGNCASKVKAALESIPEVNSAEVDHATGSAHVDMSAHVPNITIENVLAAKGNYHLVNGATAKAKEESEDSRTFLETYKPILLIAGFLVIVSALAARGEDPFWPDFMRFFMAGFFLVFSFFKFLDVKGFAQSYSTYDLLAQKWKGWGTIYPFVEFGLGIAYLLNLVPFAVNLTTIIVMGFSSIGVIQSVLNKKTIKCACLGTVFNLPMSTVTIIEDLLMVLMAAYMLLA